MLTPTTSQFRLHRKPAPTPTTPAGTSGPVSFGYGNLTPVPAGNVQDLTGVAYDSNRQLAMVGATPYIDRPGAPAGTAYNTVTDGQTWTDRD